MGERVLVEEGEVGGVGGAGTKARQFVAAGAVDVVAGEAELEIEAGAGDDEEGGAVWRPECAEDVTALEEARLGGGGVDQAQVVTAEPAGAEGEQRQVGAGGGGEDRGEAVDLGDDFARAGLGLGTPEEVFWPVPGAA